ncbi:hypothetical protein [uncultured Aliivibrio sp.]|uniref:hypothetical protein n=1 Tax=uncultured Aliivibrio sp. TaxID=873085 RepID=UPI00263957FD|nr:hypothetical protein [uncultured Aliivibrio sp.]
MHSTIFCELQNDTFYAALRKKHEHWKYENEVRLIAAYDSGVFTFSAESLECVILGMLISNQDKATILALLKLPQWKHVKVYTASARGFELALDLNELGTSRD